MRNACDDDDDDGGIPHASASATVVVERAMSAARIERRSKPRFRPACTGENAQLLVVPSAESSRESLPERAADCASVARRTTIRLAMNGDVEHVKLVRPRLELAPAYFAFIDEMRAAGETIWPSRVPADGDDDATFVAKLLAKESGAEAPAVNESVHWAIADAGDCIVVGVIALRHELNEKLARFGGHVGYEVRPSRRKRGIATAMLRLLLETERARSMRRILITCAPSNTASRRAIEANGGVLERMLFVDEIDRETCHYWIDLG
jgi:predicted acetyltransferase